LSRAAEKGDERIVKLLLEHGASPYFEDSPGQTPVSRAKNARKTAVLELLLLENRARPDIEHSAISAYFPV
jgi:ankyrin repeat protein